MHREIPFKLSVKTDTANYDLVFTNSVRLNLIKLHEIRRPTPIIGNNYMNTASKFLLWYDN